MPLLMEEENKPPRPTANACIHNFYFYLIVAIQLSVSEAVAGGGLQQGHLSYLK